jgi:hypothetical protein
MNAPETVSIDTVELGKRLFGIMRNIDGIAEIVGGLEKEAPVGLDNALCVVAKAIEAEIDGILAVCKVLDPSMGS